MGHLPARSWGHRATVRQGGTSQLKTGTPVGVPVLSVDAAAGCGAGLVLPRERVGRRPRLAGTWTWRADSYEAWCRKMERCIVEALAYCEEHMLPVPLFVVERAEGSSRYGKRGVDMFQGLGRRQGLALAEWRHARRGRGRVGKLVRQSWWAGVLNLPAGKDDAGTHRIGEARTVLAGAADALSPHPPDLQVDAAEAALQGAAVSLYGGGLL